MYFDFLRDFDFDKDHKEVTVKLFDYGCSRILLEEEESKTLVGTLQHMAPEVLLGKGYTAKADVWSLGTMTCQMQSSRLPFTGNT